MKKTEFRALQAIWYAKLRETGFVDIEGGRDLNQMSASTFSAGNRERGWIGFDFYSDDDWTSRIPNGHSWWGNTQENKLARLSEDNGSLSPADTARGSAWRTFGCAANDLKRSRRKSLLLAVSEKGYIDPTDLRRFRFTANQAYGVVHEFCREIGLPVSGLLSKGRKKGVRPNGRH